MVITDAASVTLTLNQNVLLAPNAHQGKHLILVSLKFLKACDRYTCRANTNMLRTDRQTDGQTDVN